MKLQQDLAKRILPLHTSPKTFKYDLDETHDIIINKLLQDSFTDDERYALAPFIRVMGIPSSKIEIYRTLWQDKDPRVDRTTLLSVIFHTDLGSTEFNKLSEIERIDMADPWLYPMFLLGHHEFAKSALSALVASTAVELRPLLAARMELFRKKAKAPTDVYQHCWDHANFALPF